MRRGAARERVPLVAALLAWAGAAAAGQLWSDPAGQRQCSLDGALKWTSLLARGPADAVLYPERWSSTALWRGRLSLSARPWPWLRGEVAYEQRARTTSEAAGAGGGTGMLAASGAAPYRLHQLDASLVAVGSTFSYRHELDRAWIAARAGLLELTAGRQAVGLGRGVLFSAIDLFGPFSPLESDREWRRGIDAVRLSGPLRGMVGWEMLGALEEDGASSIAVGRVHGYAGPLDGELIAGRRRGDWVAGASASAPAGPAEVHGEAAVFHPEEGRRDVVLAAVAGGSWRFADGEGMALAEYLYSGFGLEDVSRLSDPASGATSLERLRAGDLQILGRHGLAAQATWGLSGAAPVSVAWILSPADGSGVAVAAVTWAFSDSLTLACRGYAPHGRPSRDGRLRSEYGATPATGLVQISFYQ